MFCRRWLLLRWPGSFLGICGIGEIWFCLDNCSFWLVVEVLCSAFFVVACDHWAHIVHTWISYLCEFLLKIIFRGCNALKVLRMIFSNFLPTLVFATLLNGRLYHVIFLLRFFVGCCCILRLEFKSMYMSASVEWFLIRCQMILSVSYWRRVVCFNSSWWLIAECVNV